MKDKQIPDNRMKNTECGVNKIFILDPCCGGRMMWINRNHPNVLFTDIERKEKGCISYRPNFSVEPDRIMDFRKMNLPNKSFKLVVFDPPHLKTLGETSYYRKKYGGLHPETWQRDLKLGFDECWRVLENYGVLIFKWNDYEIPYAKVLNIIKIKPLFQNTFGKKNSTTYWACFMKIPKGVVKRDVK